ncbi:alpha/beta hydrolase domain-containing protein [Rhizobiaceae bacterium BDR2-2]|uniref:Alpha/beta hydrolase domain-containing protein n=1 Tax=Ectorhizobium quercum TaxID=2965071 RepID=A0AAE3MZE8_9HYPH|nr:alpha/beta hydrolase domain-containing protein [Ectorhizobium quercum]MCX8997126.1 alpha/beta hydrolase domain-containing protein [Ectorhizobium quercum]
MTTPPRIKITDLTQTDFANGVSFGDTGVYETLSGKAEISVDPADPSVSHAYDMALAGRDDDGHVSAQTDIWILRPKDPAKANGTILFEFVNRGNKRCLQFFNNGAPTNRPSSAADAGNGFLMRQGYTVVIAAWQGDVLPGDGRMTIKVPEATGNGTPLSARIKVEFICDTPGVTCLPLSGKTGTYSYPARSLDPAAARLQRRRYPHAQPETLGSDRWSFTQVLGNGGGLARGDVQGGEQALIPSASHIHLPEGFRPGWIYELTYEATRPLVFDMGFIAVRELIAFFKNDRSPANPLAAGGTLPKFAIAWGRSQSGRCIRDFIYRGFNADYAGRRVFDGMLPHISGAGKTMLNRFANLVVAASRQYEDNLNPADRFPFSYAMSRDHISGRKDAILKRPETDPLVIHTQTASEYWHRRGSLVHTDSRGNDLELPETVRYYYWASSQHWSDPTPAKPPLGICTNHQNIVSTVAFFRGTLLLMQKWLEGEAPPPSRYPKKADGTLVSFEEWRAAFPAIPGTLLPREPNLLPAVDYGPGFDEGAPAPADPAVDANRHYAVLVPATDADGNDRAGLLAPMVQVPLGTYTGWNLRGRGHGYGALHDFSGSYIPFPVSAEERALTGDPRPAILERFDTPQDYSDAIRRAAETLCAEGFYHPDDIEFATAMTLGFGAVNHLHDLST